MSENPSYKYQSTTSDQPYAQYSASPNKLEALPQHLQNKYSHLKDDQKQAFADFYLKDDIRTAADASSHPLIAWEQDHSPPKDANLIVMQYLKETPPAAPLPQKWYDVISFKSTQKRLKEEHMITDDAILPNCKVHFRWKDLCLPPDPKVQKDFVGRLLRDLRTIFHDIPNFNQSVRIFNVTNGSLSVFILVGLAVTRVAVAGLVIVEYMVRFFKKRPTLGQAPLGVLANVEFIRDPDNHHKLRRDFPRILTLDGGGVRGILTLRMLKSIEERLRARDPTYRINDLFDWIVGTSTGAIIAFLLRRGSLINDINYCFIQLASCIFPMEPWIISLFRIPHLMTTGAMHSVGEFERITNTYFEGQHSLSAVQVANAPIRSMAFATLNSTTGSVFLVSPINAPNITVTMALRMSTAVPWYLPPVYYNGHKYVDVGLGCNNPTLCFLQSCTLDMRRSCVVCSIGTGRNPLNRERVPFPLCPEILSQALEHFSDAEVIHTSVSGLMFGERNYFRFQTNLHDRINLDDCNQIHNMLMMPIPEVTDTACEQLLAALLPPEWDDDFD